MTSVASILNDVGIPWPDADSGKAREAAQAWTALGQAATDAMSTAGNAAEVLSTHNTGAAMDAFGTYWASIGGPYGVCVPGTPHSMLPVLVEACDALTSACTRFADAVDEVKSKLEDIAVEIGAALAAGVLATVVTLGVSDAVSAGVVATLTVTGLDLVEVFGTTIAEIIGQMAVGAVFGAVDSVLDMTLVNGAESDLGQPLPSDGEELKELITGVVVSSLSAGIGTTATAGTKVAAAAIVKNLPDTVSALEPDIPVIVGSVPGWLETPAGKTLVDVGSDSLANGAVAGVQGKKPDAPTIADILGGLLDAKIEGAAEGGEGEKGGG
jgi:hypothetical protein